MSSLKIDNEFDLCIVDEACQAAQLECFMCVVKANRFILAGDPFQLCAPFGSLYEHLKMPVKTLSVQYRMPRSLFQFSNSYFYNNVVKSDVAETFKFFDQKNIMFIDTKNGYEKPDGKSFLNDSEADVALKCITWLKKTKQTNI
jgi:superfamily I DNA and/or RNA helicase